MKAFATDFQTLMSDIKDGAVDTDAATAAINRLSTELGIPPSEVIAMGLEEIGRLTDVNNEKMDAHRAKLKEQADAYQLASAGLAQAIDDADAFAAALDRVNEASELDFSMMALDTVDSFDAMKEAIEGTKDVAVDWATVDLTPDSVEELKGIPDELAAVTAGDLRDARLDPDRAERSVRDGWDRRLHRQSRVLPVAGARPVPGRRSRRWVRPLVRPGAGGSVGDELGLIARRHPDHDRR